MAILSTESTNAFQDMLKQNYAMMQASFQESVQSAYHEACQAQADSGDFTSFHPEQQDWSWDNLPDILYQLKPTGPKSKIEPPDMPYPINGKLLRDIPVLPDHIASDVDEFRVEAWMRLDRRIRLSDITDRMSPEFRIAPNALQQRGGRFRQAFGMLAWDSGNKLSRELESKLMQTLMEHGIDPNLNTTRGLTPGLIIPALGEAGGRIPLPPTYTLEKRKKRKRCMRATGPKKPKKMPKAQEQMLVNTAKEALRVFQNVGPAPSQNGIDSGVPTNSQIKQLMMPGESVFAVEIPAPDTLSVPVTAIVPDLDESNVNEDWPMSDAVQVEPLYKLVPAEQNLDQPTGPLPVFRGEVPDLELPGTVCPMDLDMTLGAKNPWSDGYRVLETVGHWTKVEVKSTNGLKPGKSGDQTLFNPYEEMQLPTPTTVPCCADIKARQPTGGLFLMKPPSALDALPNPYQVALFNHCLRELNFGEQYVFNLPFFGL
ncbi:hypothetical protein BO83DRAFT_417177 [Aspergillus eucalypticola CBS 122712]|uniref:Uncharacterized protein n=1 Tax=Aspergillus eucalypticola (strain CBS 122712 / IBT 29274) TaxID=1448314 RepID=A0A317VKD2_ASPEC|nr:uncharacterized protein BO83DRAFT_417177 [Aspergillus eucalypticola CBS 122712]PWY73362.1 hypothetical protein BO83DRAFT_417177 [Aspergillus eucalypticola CBS 122712]